MEIACLRKMRRSRRESSIGKGSSAALKAAAITESSLVMSMTTLSAMPRECLMRSTIALRYSSRRAERTTSINAQLRAHRIGNYQHRVIRARARSLHAIVANGHG